MGTKHDAKTKQPEEHGGNDQIKGVFKRYVNRIFTSGKPRFETQESTLHNQNQHRCN